MATTLVIVGVTGDLSRRKLIPAVYYLHKQKRVVNLQVVGVGTREITVEEILNASVKHAEKDLPKILKPKFTYVRGDVTKEDLYEELEKHIPKEGELIFYLAVSPNFFEVITKHLKKYAHRSKIAFEKPFGSNGKQAKELNECIHKVYSENKVYRVDHYLGKELVQGLSILRFTNTFLQPLWQKKHIDHIQIILDETLGIEDRGRFYDKYGAIKDVLQNHALQLLALTTMEEPKLLKAQFIREEKRKILENVKIEEVELGQYKGYKEEKDILSDSKTETFVAVKCIIDTPRWRDVPIFMRMGKKMKKRETKIHIQFEEPPCHLFEGVCPLSPNKLVINIQPNEGFYLTINTKAPGKQNIKEAKMDFSHQREFGINTPEAYENIIEDIIEGDQSSFVHAKEIEAAWKVVDTMPKKTSLSIYDKEIPLKAIELIRKRGKSWQ